MKKQYRVVSLLLSALLIVGAASGCGGRTEAESSAPALPGTESVVSTAAGASGSEGTGDTQLSTQTDASGNVITQASNAATTKNNAGNQGGKTTTTTKTAATQVPIQNPDKIDLKGRTVTIRPWWGFQNGEGIEEAARRQKAVIDQIEDKFNCILKVTYEGLSDEQLKASIMSGSPKADFFGIQGVGALYEYVNAGCLLPLSSVKNFDYKNAAKYVQTDMGTIKGKTYAVAPLGHGWIRRNFNNILMCNFTLTSAAGYTADKIYSLVDNNQWTWAKFEEVCKAVSRISGKYGLSDLDQTAGVRFGFDTSYLFYTSMLYSNGTDWIGLKNGMPFFNGRDAKAQAVLEQYRSWSDKNTGFIRHNKTAEADFAAGNAAFFCTIYPMPIIADWISGDAKNKTGTVPMPTGPSGGGNSSYQFESIFLVVPKNVKDVSKIGAVLDAFCSPLYNDTESRQLAQNDIRKTLRVEQSLEQMMNIYSSRDAAQFPASQYGVAANLGITNDSKNLGWYDYVGKVVTGEMTAEKALASFEARCNNILNKTFG